MPRSTDDLNNKSAIEKSKIASLDLIRQIREGKSFSGKERNCAFLNLGDGSFGNISSVSGLDFIDDGRSLGLTDWDLDGDVDLFLTNRTSPQFRFVKNESQGDRHFVSFKLTGVKSNRDAIGARIELEIAGQPLMIRTIRAGSGFLSQSSKRAHFGLGQADSIAKLTVRWPDGTKQTIEDVAVDVNYELTQGKPLVESKVGKSLLQSPGALDYKDTAGGASSAMFAPAFRFPITDYQSSAGKRVTWDFSQSEFTLVNIWASWCQPCLTELEEFSAAYPELKANHGLNIIAISTDGLEGQQNSRKDSQEKAKSIGFPFEWGTATESFLDKLTMLRGKMFQLRQPFPIPTSFLVDKKGDTRKVYLGAVSVEQIKSDMKLFVQDDVELRVRLTPFGGRWESLPKSIDYLTLSEEFASGGFEADAKLYDSLAGRNKAKRVYGKALEALERGDRKTAVDNLELATQFDATYPLPFLVLGNVFAQQAQQAGGSSGRTAYQLAIRGYQEVLKLEPENKDALLGLGVCMSGTGQIDEAIKWIEKSAEVEPLAEVYSLLTRLYDAKGDSARALASCRLAVKAEPKNIDALIQLARRLRRSAPEESAALVARAKEVRADHPAVLVEDAIALMDAGDLESAGEAFGQMGQSRDPDVLLRQAWIMAVSPKEGDRNGRRSAQLASAVVGKTQLGRAVELEVLAAALAESGQFQLAVQRQGLAMESLAGSQKTMAEKRMQAYRSQKPFRQTVREESPFVRSGKKLP